MTGPEHLIELFHGYTYSGNPIAAAAGLATLEIYAEEGLFERAAALAPVLGGRRCIRCGTARTSSTSATRG